MQLSTVFIQLFVETVFDTNSILIGTLLPVDLEKKSHFCVAEFGSIIHAPYRLSYRQAI
jgi:hypothetical protein